MRSELYVTFLLNPRVSLGLARYSVPLQLDHVVIVVAVSLGQIAHDPHVGTVVAVAWGLGVMVGVLVTLVAGLGWVLQCVQEGFREWYCLCEARGIWVGG